MANAYDSEKDKELWRIQSEEDNGDDFDIVVRIMEYDGGKPKVGMNRYNKVTDRWQKLGRLTQKETAILATQLNAAATELMNIKGY